MWHLSFTLFISVFLEIVRTIVEYDSWVLWNAWLRRKSPSDFTIYSEKNPFSKYALPKERLEKIREAPHVPEAVSCPSESQKASFVKRSVKKRKNIGVYLVETSTKQSTFYMVFYASTV